MHAHCRHESYLILRRSPGRDRRKMDESWRMRMGMATTKPNLPHRRSTEDTSRRAVSETLDPEDFRDVFGGPPRSVLYRQFSGGDFARSNLFYEEVFRLPEDMVPARRGRNLPEFRIPASGGGRRSEEFYSDVFGKDAEDLRRSRSRSKANSKSKSKSNSSSVLSSEDFSPFRPATTDDDVSFSSFASKLRPLNVPSKWNSSTMMHEARSRQQWAPDFPCNPPSYLENHLVENEYIENLRSSHFGFWGRASSPETISLEPNSYGCSVKVSADDLELNSPSSVVSSLFEHQEAKASKIQDELLQEQATEQEEDEVMSSYVIEINSDQREGTGEAHGINEAIAWAKEKFQTQSSEKEWGMRRHEKENAAELEDRPRAHQFQDGQTAGCGSVQSPVDEKPNKWPTEEENQQLEEDMEMELLAEDIRLWSAGKEANIQLLLSTLHHILWPDSGWYPIPLTNLKESSNVKKAYQKARLCLHPDKLQQRGATLPQKFVAERAFPILQDAWAAFLSQDVIFI